MLDKISKMFHSAEGVVILAGAGMGVDSGLPDFRGNNGMWTKAKEDFISLATAKAFDEDPVVSWNFYIDRMIKYHQTVPHAGYQILLQALKDHNKDYFVVTTNVDGHFQKSGYDSNRIYEMHGNLRNIQCKIPCTKNLYPMPIFDATLTSVDQVPRCPQCNKSMRPNVMMFSDPRVVWTDIDQGSESYQIWAAPKIDILGIEIGAGTVIPSLRYFSEERTTSLIRINPHESSISRSQDISITATALLGIQQFIKLL